MGRKKRGALSPAQVAAARDIMQRPEIQIATISSRLCPREAKTDPETQLSLLAALGVLAGFEVYVDATDPDNLRVVIAQSESDDFPDAEVVL